MQYVKHAVVHCCSTSAQGTQARINIILVSLRKRRVGQDAKCTNGQWNGSRFLSCAVALVATHEANVIY